MAGNMDSVEKAAMNGNVAFLEEVGVDVIQNFRTEFGDSALAFAAIYGHSNCCQVIYRRCPHLLYDASIHGTTALHQAAGNGHDDVVKFLLRARGEQEVLQNGNRIVEDIETGGKLGELVDYKLLLQARKSDMQTALHRAVIRNFPKTVKLLLEADSGNNLLRMADNQNETPLHHAVRNHNLEIVKLLLETDPGCSYAPNISGQTPHLIALQESSSGDTTAVAIRKFLIEKQPEECKRRTGGNGWTLLHHAAFKGDITALEEILEFSPDCAKLVDNEGQNFFHLAAKLEHEKVVRHILASTKVDESVLNQQDVYGNTPLHIATSKGNATMGLAMLYDPRIDKFALSNQGKTALSAIKFDYDKKRAGVYLTDNVDEKVLKERSDFDLLVGTLIATLSFTAGIAVPGGYLDDGPNEGTAVLHKKKSFDIFVISNTIALVLSLGAVFSHFCTRRLVKQQNILYQLKVATYCSLGSIIAMIIAFMTGSYTVLAVSHWLSITVCVLCGGFFGIAFPAVWMVITEQQQRRPSHTR